MDFAVVADNFWRHNSTKVSVVEVILVIGRSRLVVTDQIIDGFRDNPTFASFLDFSLLIFENFRYILLVTWNMRDHVYFFT